MSSDPTLILTKMFDPHIYARQPLVTSASTSTISPHGSPQKTKHSLSNTVIPIQNANDMQKSTGDVQNFGQIITSNNGQSNDETHLKEMVVVGELNSNHVELITTTNLIANDISRDVDSGAGSSGQASRKTSTISDYASSEYTPENTMTMAHQNANIGGDGNSIMENETTNDQLMVDTTLANDAALTPDNIQTTVDQNTPVSSGGFNLKLPPARKLSRFIVSPVVAQTGDNKFIVVGETTQPRSPPTNEDVKQGDQIVADGQDNVQTTANVECIESVKNPELGSGDGKGLEQANPAEQQNPGESTASNPVAEKKTEAQPQKQPAKKLTQPPLTLEELKKQLEDITHVHIPVSQPPPKQTSNASQISSSQISALQQEKIKQEIQKQLTNEIEATIKQQIQHQIQQTFKQMNMENADATASQNTAEVSGETVQSSGPGSNNVTKENTSVHNSRRASVDMTQSMEAIQISGQNVNAKAESQLAQVANVQNLGDIAVSKSPQFNSNSVGAVW
jgi:hypothetical protein